MLILTTVEFNLDIVNNPGFLVLADGVSGLADAVGRGHEASTVLGDVDRDAAERDVMPVVRVVASKLAGRTNSTQLFRTKANAPLLRRRSDREFDLGCSRHSRRSTHSCLKKVRILFLTFLD